jgi:hypothetical protein
MSLPKTEKDAAPFDWLAFALGVKAMRAAKTSKPAKRNERIRVAILLACARLGERGHPRDHGAKGRRANRFVVAWLAGMAALWAMSLALVIAGRAASEHADVWIVADSTSAWEKREANQVEKTGRCGTRGEKAALLGWRCVAKQAPALAQACAEPQCRIVRIRFAQAAAWVALNRFPEPLARAGASKANAWTRMDNASPGGVVVGGEALAILLVVTASAWLPLRRETRGDEGLAILWIQSAGLAKGFAVMAGIGAILGVLVAGPGVQPELSLDAAGWWRLAGGALLGAGFAVGAVCSLVWRIFASGARNGENEVRQTREALRLGAPLAERERLLGAAHEGEIAQPEKTAARKPPRL